MYPAAMALAVTPCTKLGVPLAPYTPLLLWVFQLSPQHFMAPPLSSAQVWLAPAETATAFETPETSTGIDFPFGLVLLELIEPSPSWP